jgi:hypothetical protein
MRIQKLELKGEFIMKNEESPLKRVIATMLTVLMVLTLIVPVSFASVVPPEPIIISLPNITAQAGDTITVPITVANNPDFLEIGNLASLNTVRVGFDSNEIMWNFPNGFNEQTGRPINYANGAAGAATWPFVRSSEVFPAGEFLAPPFNATPGADGLSIEHLRFNVGSVEGSGNGTLLTLRLTLNANLNVDDLVNINLSVVNAGFADWANDQISVHQPGVHFTVSGATIKIVEEGPATISDHSVSGLEFGTAGNAQISFGGAGGGLKIERVGGAAIPAGMVIDPDTGAITTTADTPAGSYVFSVRASNTIGGTLHSQTANVTVVVAPKAIAITQLTIDPIAYSNSATIPPGAVNVTFDDASFTAFGVSAAITGGDFGVGSKPTSVTVTPNSTNYTVTNSPWTTAMVTVNPRELTVRLTANPTIMTVNTNWPASFAITTTGWAPGDNWSNGGRTAPTAVIDEALSAEEKEAMRTKTGTYPDVIVLLGGDAGPNYTITPVGFPGALRVNPRFIPQQQQRKCSRYRFFVVVFVWRVRYGYGCRQEQFFINIVSLQAGSVTIND